MDELDLNLAQLILVFLTLRYPASYTSDEITRRLNLSQLTDRCLTEEEVTLTLRNLRKGGHVEFSMDLIENAAVWRSSRKGLVTTLMYVPKESMKRKKTIYIAGQMAGLPNNNMRAFNDAEERLRKDGWHTINPVKFDYVFSDALASGLLDVVCESERAAIPYLDAIYLLKGWEKSKGAKRELAVALRHNLEVIVEE